MAADLPLLRSWLEQPHVSEWWGDPDEELALIETAFDGHDGTAGFVVHFNNEPVGYIQSWKPDWYASDAKWVAQAPWLTEVQGGALGVDMLIGPADRVNQGLGSLVLRAFCAMLFDQGAPCLIIDPDAANQRAVRAYEKAGFVRYGQYRSPEDTTVLMTMLPPER